MRLKLALIPILLLFMVTLTGSKRLKTPVADLYDARENACFSICADQHNRRFSHIPVHYFMGRCMKRCREVIECKAEADGEIECKQKAKTRRI